MKMFMHEDSSPTYHWAHWKDFFLENFLSFWQVDDMRNMSSDESLQNELSFLPFWCFIFPYFEDVWKLFIMSKNLLLNGIFNFALKQSRRGQIIKFGNPVNSQPNNAVDPSFAKNNLLCKLTKHEKCSRGSFQILIKRQIESRSYS